MSTVRNILATSILAGGFALASQAQAEILGPGQWSLGGIQQICIVSGGSWYSPTFAGWAGRYTTDSRAQVLYGNYASGVGNDVIEALGGAATGGASDWMEWRDDLSFQSFSDDVRWTFVKTVCDPPPAVAANGVQAPVSNPFQNKK